MNINDKVLSIKLVVFIVDVVGMGTLRCPRVLRLKVLRVEVLRAEVDNEIVVGWNVG